MLFPWIKRPDLISVPHDSGGWVVKDPLTLHYTWLDETEHAILNLLDGKVTLQTLLNSVHQLSPQQAITASDIGPFVQSLAGHQLIRQVGPGDSLRLNPSPSPARPLGLRFVQPLFQLLRIQIPLVNPSRWLTAALPVVSKFVNPLSLKLAAVMVCVASLLAVLRFGELKSALPSMREFLGPQNMILMLIVFVVVKVLHEAGHALTAKTCGAECNECGVMLMVFTPVLYTNVTDSWMLPRRQRLLVTAAGIAVELVIAAACMLLWWQAAPGLLKSVLLNTMLMCSVNTLLFNGNPLLRFDGYFVLADLLRLPNMASRSVAVVRDAALRLVTGQSEGSSESGRTHVVLMIYGVLSLVYRVFLTLAILQLVRHVTREWNVELLGSVLTITIVSGFVVFPLFQFLKRIFDLDAMLDYDTKTWIRLAAVTAAGLAVLLIPLPRSVVAPAFVQCTAAAVYATLSGSLTPEVRYGETVQSGAPLATLHNPDLQRTRQRLVGRVSELEQQFEALTLNAATANSELIPTVMESIQAAKQALQKFEGEWQKLIVKSPRSGTLFPPPAVPVQQNTDLTQFWDGTVISNRNTGAWIARGTLLGYVGADTDVELLACVSEDDVEFLRVGQSVRFQSTAGGAVSVQGVVRDVATLSSSTLPTNLAISQLINGRPTVEGVAPLEVTYLVTVSIAETSAVPPALYSVGHVRIQTHASSLFRRMQRYLRQTF